MISCDTNILFYAHNKSCPESSAARSFLELYADSEDFVLCELVLIEFYVLLRNPNLLEKTLSSSEAVDMVLELRANPFWRVIDYPGNLMNEIWTYAKISGLSRHHIYDVRMAHTLLHHGVKRFATRNTKHFNMLGFDEVINPID